jgi:MerR family transcriptional regulator, redox-sensitive transcriptional activator SoxR
MSDELLTIGELVRASGRPASSIRYYDEIGLLPALVRVSGQRRYTPAAARTLAIIDTAQRAGLSLSEIRTLLGATPDNEAAVERLRIVALRKLPEIRARIDHAMRVQEWLETAAQCNCPSFDDCGLFNGSEALPQLGTGANR